MSQHNLEHPSSHPPVVDTPAPAAVPGWHTVVDRAVIGLVWGGATGLACVLLAGVRAVVFAPALLRGWAEQDVVAGLQGLPAALLFLTLYLLIFPLAGAMLGVLTTPNWVRRVRPLAGFLAGAIVFGLVGGLLMLFEPETAAKAPFWSISAVGGGFAAVMHTLGMRLPGLEPDPRSN